MPFTYDLGLEHRLEEFAHLRGVHGRTNTALFEHLDFGLSRIITPRNQCTRMTHPLACWSGHPSNKANHRLGHVFFGPARGVHLVWSTDFTDHDRSEERRVGKEGKCRWWVRDCS